MIAVGSDHGGFALKNKILTYLDENKIPYKDYGTYTDESCSWAKMAVPACKAVQSGECDKALLFCGTGVGISMAANKMKDIRAAVCSDYFTAKFTRAHNDANVLCLGERVVGPGLACELVNIFLNTPFEGGRHSARILDMQDIEDSETK